MSLGGPDGIETLMKTQRTPVNNNPLEILGPIQS